MKDILPPLGETGRDRGGRRDEPWAVPHTQVHSLVRRTLELLQDVVATLLALLLLVLSLQTLWRLARMAIAGVAATTELLSDIIFVLILMEVYRLMIYYLREHRISVALMVEVALVSILREVMLKGTYGFEWFRLVGLSLLLGVLGGLLAMERWMGRWRNEASEADSRCPSRLLGWPDRPALPGRWTCGPAPHDGLLGSRLLPAELLVVGHGLAMCPRAGFPAPSIVQFPEPLVASVEYEPVTGPDHRRAPRYAKVQPVRAVDAQNRDPLVEELQVVEPPAFHPVAGIDPDPPDSVVAGEFQQLHEVPRVRRSHCQLTRVEQTSDVPFRPLPRDVPFRGFGHQLA